MPRPLVIGNGKFLINLDQHCSIRDLYYPYVGQLNHVGGYRCRMGIWVDGQFSWLSDPEWRFHYAYIEDSLVTNVQATHGGLGITLEMNDGVHQRDDIYIKRVKIVNHRSASREIRVFFNQDLIINETEVGDTAAYYPANHTLFHYKRDKYFMFNGSSGEDGIFQYTTGVKRFYHAEGTWKDAEDGHLMGNPIAQGSVDSTISFRAMVGPTAIATVYYWLSAGGTLEEVKKKDQYVKESHPSKLLDRVEIYWQRWVNKAPRNFGDLSDGIINLYKLSLLIVRTQTDVRGAIVAANDSDILHSNRDHYSYMWPRDGALVAYAMSMAGYQGMAFPFFEFCDRVMAPEGYLHHKYNPDGTVGSSWHPYIAGGKYHLPIQEDETGLTLFALWRDFERHGVIELPQSLYSTLIRRAARFMSLYIEEDLNLPKPSYDLWEERYGIYTFTAAAVYGGLEAAANFCSLFGDDERSSRYRRAAERIKAGILEHLWDEGEQRFVRGLYSSVSGWTKDKTLESSVYGLFEFGVLPADDPRMVSTMQGIKRGLAVRTSIGGIARYQHDYYFQRSNDIDNVPGNPWIICTLWVAEWEIACARTLADMESPRRTLEWVVSRAMESGVLPEQLDPFSGEPVSVAPLTWSHATFVLTVDKYMAKFTELRERDQETSKQGMLIEI
jgi:GH15 family glucan-1,4-alpha-glucosidase